MNIIRNISNIRSLFQESKVKIFGLGAYPSTRSEIWSFVPDYEIICANKTGEYTSVRKKIKINIFSGGKKYPDQAPENILKRKGVIAYLKKTSQGKKAGLYYYKPSRRIDHFCKENNLTAIANPGHFFEKLDDKLEFLKILQKIGAKRNSAVVKVNELERSLPFLFKKFGKKIVIQFPKEGGGRGTFFFHKKEANKITDQIKKVLKSAEVRHKSAILVVSQFINGPSISISGCITKNNGVLASYCRYQLTDIKGAAKIGPSGVFCGNDWTLSPSIPSEIHQKSSELTKKIGEILKKQGLLGIFGIDLIWDQENNTLIPLEINPRLLGTNPLSVHVSLENGEVPLEAFHVLEFFKIPYRIASEKVYKKKIPKFGSHLIIYNQFGRPISCKRELKGGVYKLTKKKIEYQRSGFELGDIKNAREFVLTDGIPKKGFVYRKNRKLLRIITRSSLVKKSGAELNGWGKAVVSRVLEGLDIPGHK